MSAVLGAVDAMTMGNCFLTAKNLGYFIFLHVYSYFILENVMYIIFTEDLYG